MEASPSPAFGLTDPQTLQTELFADVLRQFSTARLVVTGASMLPAIWPGDVLTIQRKELAELRAGEIVLAQREGKLIAHRVTSVGDHLITQGDSMPQGDPPFTTSEILGRVVSILRNGRDMPLEQSLWQRAVSAILRRSDFCMRMTLRIGRRWQRLRRMELLWAR
jgi:hypothetical protein